MRRILLASFLLFGFIAYSQTTVQGKVVDENGEPVPGANVVWEPELLQPKNHANFVKAIVESPL